MSTIIELNNITKIYKGKEFELKALNNINLKIEEGEFTAIMGKSGSGKTTLLNILGCMDEPTTGEYICFGEKIHEFSKKEVNKFRKNNISFIFQQYALMSQYTVYENVELPLLAKNIGYKERKQIVNDSLEKVSIANLSDKYPNNISGGQRQRVAIARTLASGNKIVLADEPTGALDYKTGEEIFNILKKLKDEGKTVLVVTHNEDLAKKCTRIIKIQDGTILK